jgi:hypothetical protein
MSLGWTDEPTRINSKYKTCNLFRNGLTHFEFGETDRLLAMTDCKRSNFVWHVFDGECYIPQEEGGHRSGATVGYYSTGTCTDVYMLYLNNLKILICTFQILKHSLINK